MPNRAHQPSAYIDLKSSTRVKLTIQSTGTVINRLRRSTLVGLLGVSSRRRSPSDGLTRSRQRASSSSESCGSTVCGHDIVGTDDLVCTRIDNLDRLTRGGYFKAVSSQKSENAGLTQVGIRVGVPRMLVNSPPEFWMRALSLLRYSEYKSRHSQSLDHHAQASW